MSLSTPQKVVYPETDGLPMAENTLQFEWIVTIKEGLDALFRDDPDVFVAGDLFWYPVEGDPATRAAPDTMVVLGRPRGHRGSYRQWEEGGLAPQVVFEVLSPGNRFTEMLRKFQFYERFGVEEYYVYDPDRLTLEGWTRRGEALVEVPRMDGWTSPRLGIRFDLSVGPLRILRPDGQPFLTYAELALDRDRAIQERDQAIQEREAARQKAERLAARLRELGLDPDA